MIVDIKNKIVQLLVVEGGLPVGKATLMSKEVFELIDYLCEDKKITDDKTGNLFENESTGGSCKHCGTFYNNLMRLSEHEEICKGLK